MTPPAADRGRSRRVPRPLRRGLPMLVGLALLAVWLGVRSGDQGAPGAPADDPAPSIDPPPAPGPERPRAAAADGAGADEIAARERADPRRDESEPADTSPTVTVPAPDADADTEAGRSVVVGPGRTAVVDTDRVAFRDRIDGLERRLDAVHEVGDLVDVAVRLARIDPPDDPDLSARLDALRAALVARADARIAAATAAARRGAVLDAAAEIGALLAATGVAERVRTALGIAAGVDVAAATAGEPAPEPLPRGLVVRFAAPDGETAATVARSDAVRATLQIEGGGFPTVPRTELGFDAARADLAVAQALVAARAGRAALAWAWLERAAALPGAPGARIAALRDRLAGR